MLDYFGRELSTGYLVRQLSNPTRGVATILAFDHVEGEEEVIVKFPKDETSTYLKKNDVRLVEARILGTSVWFDEAGNIGGTEPEHRPGLTVVEVESGDPGDRIIQELRLPEDGYSFIDPELARRVDEKIKSYPDQDASMWMGGHAAILEVERWLTERAT